MFIELHDGIRECPISINVDVIEGFYDIAFYYFDEESDWLIDAIDNDGAEINAVIEVKDARLYVEETYEEIRTALKVHGCYSK